MLIDYARECLADACIAAGDDCHASGLVREIGFCEGWCGDVVGLSEAGFEK